MVENWFIVFEDCFFCEVVFGGLLLKFVYYIVFLFDCIGEYFKGGFDGWVNGFVKFVGVFECLGMGCVIYGDGLFIGFFGIVD